MDVPAFSLKVGNTDFLNKQKSLCDILSLVEKEVKQNPNDPYSETEEPISNKRKRKETKGFRGQESLFKEQDNVFKQPQELPPRNKRVPFTPDFQRNPKRWKKYSLADVGADELSDESNTSVALDFLKMCRRNKRQEIKMDIDEPNEQTQFNSSGHKFCVSTMEISKNVCFGDPIEPQIDNKEAQKPVFKNSRLVMPEYVVGLGQEDKKKLKKPKNQIIGTSEKQVQLSHLNEYYDE